MLFQYFEKNVFDLIWGPYFLISSIYIHMSRYFAKCNFELLRVWGH